MTALPHHVHTLPSEKGAPDEGPRNALLDAFEAQVEALVDNGFEAQLRARLSRLLPPLRAAADAPVARAADAAASSASPRFATVDDELSLMALIADCKRMGKLKATALSHAMIGRIQAVAEADLAALRKLARAA